MNNFGAVTKDDLQAFVEKTDELGGPDSPAALAYWQGFVYKPDVIVDQSLDPLSAEYFDQQIALYREISGRQLDPHENELTDFDIQKCFDAPNPYGRQSPRFVADHARAVCEAIALADLDDHPAVLDLGSGWGLSSELLAFTGCSVMAVDINPRFTELAARRAARMGLEIEATHSSFDEFETEKRFDAVFFYECLHHAQKPWELLRRCGTFVKDDGKLIISGEPINDIWWKSWGLRLDPLSVYCIRRFGWFESGWSMSFLKQMLMDAGFSPAVYEGKGLGGTGVVIARRLALVQALDLIQQLKADQASLTRERDALRAERSSLVACQASLSAERDALAAQRDALLTSRSWKVTSPIRRLSSWLRRI